MFADARAFTQRFIDLAPSGFLVPSPDVDAPPADAFTKAAEAVKAEVRQHRLPPLTEDLLLMTVDQLAQLAAAAAPRPSYEQAIAEIRLFNSFNSFHSTLASMEGLHLTRLQADRLLAMVVFGGDGVATLTAFCIAGGLKVWLVQAALALAA